MTDYNMQLKVLPGGGNITHKTTVPKLPLYAELCNTHGFIIVFTCSIYEETPLISSSKHWSILFPSLIAKCFAQFLSLLKKGWFYQFAGLVARVTDWLLSRWLLPGCRWPSAVRPWWSRCSPAESNISAQSPSAPGICLPCLHTENSAAVFKIVIVVACDRILSVHF